MGKLVKFRIGPGSAPPRSECLSPHQMLCSLFEDETPLMDFLKDIFQQHGILTVRDWDQFGGNHLFEKFLLDDASRKQFNKTVGTPHRSAAAGSAKLLRLEFAH